MISRRALLLSSPFLFIDIPAFADDIKSSKTYVFITKALTNPYWIALKKGISDAAAAADAKVIILSPSNDQAKEEHLNLCDAALLQKPAILAMGAATTSIGIECMRKAKHEGIIVADVDATVTPEEAEHAGFAMAYTIGADNVKIGETAAQFIYDNSRKANPKILMIEGVVGSPPSDERKQGFLSAIAKLMPQANIVFSGVAEWDRLRALNITNDILVRNPDLDVIFAFNDVMALGAVQAVRNAKKSNIIILGVDGAPEARQAILAGNMTASITQLPYLIGRRTFEKAFDVVHGKKTTEVERAPLVILTKDVLEKNSDLLLQYVQ